MVLEPIVVPENFRTSLVGRCSGDNFYVWLVRKIAEVSEDNEPEDDSEG
jgi:hypothetical protein